MRRPIVAVLLVCGCFVCVGASSSGLLRFKVSGFSIHPLESQPGDTPYDALKMLLPPSGGFSPNVNVQIQPYAGTIGDYTALSLKQFVAAKFTLIKETRQGDTSVLLEYSGEVQGRQLHWYSKASSSGSTVYLATATAMEAQWPTVGTKLRACVDSLALDRGEQSLPADAEDGAAEG